MQNCRKRNPEEVWDLYICDPSHVWENCNHHPNDRTKDEQDVDRCECVTLHTKHEWCIYSIEHQVQNKWQRNDEWNIFRKCQHKYFAK